MAPRSTTQWVSVFITIAIMAFLAICAFWAAFGSESTLTAYKGLNQDNWGAMAFWRFMYALIGVGALTATIAEWRYNKLGMAGESLVTGGNKYI